MQSQLQQRIQLINNLTEENEQMKLQIKEIELAAKKQINDIDTINLELKEKYNNALAELTELKQEKDMKTDENSEIIKKQAVEIEEQKYQEYSL